MYLTVLLCFLIFFLIIDLYVLITVVIVQTFNPVAELSIPTGIPTRKAKLKIEMNPVIVETNISNCSI